MERTIENALIEEVFLGIGDHGPDAWLTMKLNGSSQGFGGYDLRGRVMYNFVNGVLKALDQRNWMSLKGKYCRIDHDWIKIYRIGHIIEDKWFDPSTDLLKGE